MSHGMFKHTTTNTQGGLLNLLLPHDKYPLCDQARIVLEVKNEILTG
jgi:hypothetical protein